MTVGVTTSALIQQPGVQHRVSVVIMSDGPTSQSAVVFLQRLLRCFRERGRCLTGRVSEKRRGLRLRTISQIFRNFVDLTKHFFSFGRWIFSWDVLESNRRRAILKIPLKRSSNLVEASNALNETEVTCQLSG